jgi:diguanylate cyclase (GGDEF)-like protein
VSKPRHKLLERQLRRATTEGGGVDLVALLASIEECYLDHELSLKRINRANALMAEELEIAARDRMTRLEQMERAQTAIAASEARVRHLAYHDTLTGLANRALLGERLAHALEVARRNGGMFAVHCIDLDQFKAVNDTFGHQAGDELIRVAADKLSTLCRKADTISRLGGDEFAIVQLNATPASASALADRLVKAMAEPIDLAIGQVHVGCSVGVTMIEDPSIDPLEALRQADLALYRAKGNGRGQYAFFEQEMDAAVRTRRALQADLRAALASGGIELAYQPQVNGEGAIVAVEALARWRHPELGMVAPSLFVPIAEECGLIVDFGFYTLKRAFEDSARWPQIKIAVNVSAHQLRMKDFVSRVVLLLQETGVDARRFELEITEGVLLGDDPTTHDTLKRLRELGFSMALDDFGTGYSSLSYLRRYPIDKIKIDRSFITNLGVDAEAEAVIFAIVNLAHSLNLNVVAEGVENQDQCTALRSAGCKSVQGYLFGKPMPATKIDQLLLRHSKAAMQQGQMG